jgi:hypothetical protein
MTGEDQVKIGCKNGSAIDRLPGESYPESG